MNREALDKLLEEMNKPDKYTLQDLFKIRDALVVLQGYGLVDMDLLIEVMKFINQEGEKTVCKGG